MIADGVTNWEAEKDPKGYKIDPNLLQDSGPALLILDDPGFFKDDPRDSSKSLESLSWISHWVKSGNERLILLRLHSRTKGTLHSALYNFVFSQPEIRQRTILVTTVRNLRANGARVGASLSWERTFDDVIRGAKRCFQMDVGNMNWRGAIVTVGLSGTVLIDNTNSKEPYSLVFQLDGQEGDFESQHAGKPLGLVTCMLAALATTWETSHTTNTTFNLLKAAEKGVQLMRRLATIGYCPSDKPRNRQVLEFPVRQIHNNFYGLHEEDTTHTELGSLSRRTYFGDRDTILANNPPGDNNPLYIPKLIATMGASALKNVPIGKVHKWYSADRTEIEGVRSVHNAIREYMTRKSDTRPLSVAVFGPPGAGKSFIVEEIAKDVGLEPALLRYNLSQFESATELARAFHQIQDVLLRGLDPLVIWDEFDSPLDKAPLGWLRLFLAPLQDAKFADRGEVHPVGRGIYIFAGGIYTSFGAFAATASDQEKIAKKPDFVSRIRAYIDVKGPNPENQGRPGDSSHMIRRAFLLNGSLAKHAKFLYQQGEFQVDGSVLKAFLTTEEYKHGSRSLDSIVALSSFDPKGKYELSSLPPEHLLAMHVTHTKDFVADP